MEKISKMEKGLKASKLFITIVSLQEGMKIIMQNDYYVKEVKIIEKTEMEKEIELIRSIIKTREELKVANRNFEYAR